MVALAISILTACGGLGNNISSVRTSSFPSKNRADIPILLPTDRADAIDPWNDDASSDPPPDSTDDPTPEPVERDTPPEHRLADAYRAYYDVLMAAVHEYGISSITDPYDYESGWEDWNEKTNRGVYSGQGVFLAELIYFGDSALPQLLYIHDDGYGPNRYVCWASVFGYSSGLEFYSREGELLIGGDNPFGELFLATDRNGVRYLNKVYSSYDYDYENDSSDVDVEDAYYAVIDGRWVEIPASEIDIVSRRAFGYSPDSVHAVLAELESLL